ncbi:hypothetical protein ACFSOZ_26325 [Mesorhizobium newzealandense]|uniref:Uncharacterized protein n=1 Tax=Mesorhizobium newzealandense TaxID=1300302 RepID=A0ABW4UHV9_9HYPH
MSVFEKPHWRAALTTRDKEKALALAKEIGDKVRVEEITPKPRKRQRPGRHFIGPLQHVKVECGVVA